VSSVVYVIIPEIFILVAGKTESLIKNSERLYHCERRMLPATEPGLREASSQRNWRISAHHVFYRSASKYEPNHQGTSIMTMTTKREQVSFKLETNTKRRLEALAAATRRTKTFVLEEAINHYLDLNEWQIKSIEEGLEDARAGRIITHETLVAKWERRVEDSLD